MAKESNLCGRCEQPPTKKHGNGRFLKRGICVDCMTQLQKEHRPKKDKKRSESANGDYDSPLDENSEHVGTVEFDMNGVLTDLGEPPDEAKEQQDSAKLGMALSKILDWLTNVDFNHKNALRAMGMRTVAMAWVIDPKRFDNASVRTLASKLGFTAANISPLTAEFSRQFTINNQFQNHDWRKE
jgi:hypothetical protein